MSESFHNGFVRDDTTGAIIVSAPGAGGGSAAALSDTNPNPTTPIYGAAALRWDATNNVWRRVGLDTGDDADAITNPYISVLPGAIKTSNGRIDRLRTAPGATGGSLAVGLQPPTSGGLSTSKLISAATTNATVVKASAGQVYGWHVSNINAAARFLKLYNKATAPTVGTDVPVLTLPIPGAAAGAVIQAAHDNGIAFAAGIGFALTAAAADADATAVAAGEIVVNLLYK